VLDGLFEIAKAMGVLHPAESTFLERGRGNFRLRAQ